MIATCASCGSRYRIAREKIGPKGARLRCTRCGEVFRVVAPAPAPEATLEPEPEPESEPRLELPPTPPPSDPKPEPRRRATDREGSVKRALIADPDPARGKRIKGFLAEGKITAVVVPDGGDALLRVFRFPPDLLVVAPGLDGIGGRGVVEVIRRAGIGDTKILRITSPDEPLGAPEFEAQATVEEGEVPDALGSALGEFGLGLVSEATSSEAPVEPQRAPRPAAPPKAERKPAPRPAAEEPVSEATRPSRPEPAAAKPKAAAAPSDPRFAEAERLARIIVSDIVLYNEDRFDEAARAGNMLEALKAELEEGRALFDGRISADIRSERDFITDELKRVAAKRGAAS